VPSLDDEPLAGAVRRVGAHFVHLTADHEAGLPTRAAQDEREHRRCRRLAVRSGDRDRAAGRGERRQRGRAVQDGDTQLPRGDQLDVSLRDRRRVHDRVGVRRHVLGSVADAHPYTRGLEARENDRILEVGAAHLVAHTDQQQRDRAHADATDAHDVQPARASVASA
jgi:hypothetical protein